MKPSLSNYSKPRPVWMKVLGDTLLYAGNAAGFACLFANERVGAAISFSVGVLAHFFTNLYKETVDEIVRQETQTTTIQHTTTVTDVPAKENNTETNNP